jgi:hypothetical protein
VVAGDAGDPAVDPQRRLEAVVRELLSHCLAQEGERPLRRLVGGPRHPRPQVLAVRLDQRRELGVIGLAQRSKLGPALELEPLHRPFAEKC